MKMCKTNTTWHLNCTLLQLRHVNSHCSELAAHIDISPGQTLTVLYITILNKGSVSTEGWVGWTKEVAYWKNRLFECWEDCILGNCRIFGTFWLFLIFENRMLPWAGEMWKSILGLCIKGHEKGTSLVSKDPALTHRCRRQPTTDVSPLKGSKPIQCSSNRWATAPLGYKPLPDKQYHSIRGQGVDGCEWTTCYIYVIPLLLCIANLARISSSEHLYPSYLGSILDSTTPVLPISPRKTKRIESPCLMPHFISI